MTDLTRNWFSDPQQVPVICTTWQFKPWVPRWIQKLIARVFIDTAIDFEARGSDTDAERTR